MSTAWIAKMPTFRRRSSGSRSTAVNATALAERFCSGASGTTQRTTANAASARYPVRAKTPGTPIILSRNGAATSEIANTAPMDTPMIAIALVRCDSRVRSATIAIATAETAPAPCTTRPAIIAQGLSEAAQRKLPAANSASPTYSRGFLPWRSESHPNGICRMPCVSP